MIQAKTDERQFDIYSSIHKQDKLLYKMHGQVHVYQLHATLLSSYQQLNHNKQLYLRSYKNKNFRILNIGALTNEEYVT